MSNEKTKKNGKSNQHILALVLSMVSLLALLMSVSFSWFIEADYTIVQPAGVDVYRPANLYIGTVDSETITWDSKFNLTCIEPVSPVCGDGLHFYTKSYFSYNSSDFSREIASGSDYTLYGYTQPDTLTELTAAEIYSNVSTTDVILSATIAGNLFLSDESKIAPNLQLSPESKELTGVSTGYIAGALRLAVFQKGSDDVYRLKCVWIPNAEYEFDSTKSTFTTDGNIEDSYTFVTPDGDSTRTITVETSGNDGYVIQDGVLYVWDLSKCDQPFATYNGPQDGYLRIVIWLDGNDRECINALSGGKADLSLGVYISHEE